MNEHLKLIQKILTCTCTFASVYDKAFQSVSLVQGSVSEMGVGEDKNPALMLGISFFILTLTLRTLSVITAPKRNPEL